jgi:serine/threonine protein kinase
MTDRSGQDLGHYRLVRLLGTGGFADVYLAEHRTLNTLAAIKVLNLYLATQEQVDQFSQEAYLIARLIHPHIVRVLDFGVEDTVPFLVMDYAPYGTLRHLYPHGTLVPLWQVLSSVQQIAPALQYAHDHQIIHRDVKPENLLLGRQGEIWLSDFGIAVVAHNTDSLPTRDTAHTVGTVAYMAPEQLRGEPRPASDQYALAIVVYEWLAGKRPFGGTPLEIVYQQQFVSPAPLQQVRSALPQEVDDVVLKALAKNPKDRFASVQAFATALEQASEANVQQTKEELSSLTTLSLRLSSPQEAVDLLPTIIRPAAPLSQPPPSPSEHAQEALQEAPAPASARPFGELTTLPESDQANQPPPSSSRVGARSSSRRRRQALVAGGLLAIALGAMLLILLSGLLSSASGRSQTSTSTPAQTLGSSPSTNQSSAPTPRPSAGGTGSALPTPVGTSTTGNPNPTGTTPPLPTSTTTTSSPTPTPLPPQLAVTPLTLNFSLSLLSCTLQNPPSQILTVENTGASGMNWQATIQNSAYLTISQGTGYLDAGQQASISVFLVCKVVVHTTDTITFTSNGGGTVVVTVTITLS